MNLLRHLSLIEVSDLSAPSLDWISFQLSKNTGRWSKACLNWNTSTPMSFPAIH